MMGSTPVQQHVNACFSSVTYRIGDCLIDPGDYWDGFNDVRIVLLTHVHFDHIYGLNKVLELNHGIPVYTNLWGFHALGSPKLNMSKYQDEPFVIDDAKCVKIVEDGDEVVLCDTLSAKAIFTPGHNPSCITWIVEDKLFTGDAYIPGIKTVTNLPGGNLKEAEKSIDKIHQLSKGKEIFPGHKI